LLQNVRLAQVVDSLPALQRGAEPPRLDGSRTTQIIGLQVSLCRSNFMLQLVDVDLLGHLSPQIEMTVDDLGVPLSPKNQHFGFTSAQK